jgi:membrane protein CcdC involved in cytochrome C biogenesis
MQNQQLQRKTDKYVISARELSSRGASFIIVMLGVILQASHTTLLMYDIAAFKQDWIKLIVALGVGIFISSALAIFTLKFDGKNKEIGQIINVFFYFEIFTNVFYYWNSLIFSKGFDNATVQNWLYLIIAMPFSFVMPYAIKKFAGVINADNRLEFGSIDTIEEVESEETVNATLEEIEKVKQLLSETIETYEQNKEAIMEEVSEKYIKKGHNVIISTDDGKQVTVKLQ